MEPLASGGRLARARQALCGRAEARGDQVRRQNRAGARVQGYRGRAPHRQRRRAGAAANPGLHPAGAGLRRAGGGGRERGLRLLPAVSHLGPTSGRRLRRAHSNQLGRIERSVGRHPVAESLHRAVPAPHDRARYAGVDRGADDRRSRVAQELGRSESHSRFPQGSRARARRLQGSEADAARLGPAAAQPILLGDGRTIVSVSPQEGFMHQYSELDTLGYDRPETKCRLQ